MPQQNACLQMKFHWHLKIKRDNYITISYTSCLNPIFVPPPATDYGWEDDNRHLSPIWAERPPILPIREHAQNVPITFIANEDIEIVESNDGEDSENDDDDVSTDVPDNDDFDWDKTATVIFTNIIIEIINGKILLIIKNVD